VKNTAVIAALATTRDCNCFRLTACAPAAPAAPKWVTDSGASNHMWNDCSSFSTFKIISLPKVIKLADDNSVTATHYGFVNVIQGYQIDALLTTTFRLSLLLINQLDLGRHMIIFKNRKCSITSPSSCNLAWNLINGIYIIVATTAPLSTTEPGRKITTEISLSRVLLTERIFAEPRTEPRIETSETPMITSMNPPASSVLSEPSTAKTTFTRKSLTISESRIWHQWLAHVNPPTMKSLLDGYPHDHSKYTVCIQVKNKQLISEVLFKRATKPFEVEH